MSYAVFHLLNSDISWSETNMHLLRHSMLVANAAYRITQDISCLDQNQAFESGLLHDIGKFYLSKTESYKHPRLGYERLRADNPEIALICLIHPFPCPNNHAYLTYYCHEDVEEVQKLTELLASTTPNLYVQLIQLCDKISGSDSYVTIDQKCEHYQQKYHVTADFIQQNVEAIYALKRKFDELAHTDIYSLLGVV